MTLDENMWIRWLFVMSPLVVFPWLPLLLATPLLYRCLHQYDTLQAFKRKQGGLGTWVSSDMQIFCIILLHWHWWCGSDLEHKLWHCFDGLSENKRYCGFWHECSRRSSRESRSSSQQCSAGKLSSIGIQVNRIEKYKKCCYKTSFKFIFHS